MCAHMHTCTHTHMHTHAHMHTHNDMHKHMHKHMHTYTHIHTHTYTYAYKQIYTHAHSMHMYVPEHHGHACVRILWGMRMVPKGKLSSFCGQGSLLTIGHCVYL